MTTCAPRGPSRCRHERTTRTCSRPRRQYTVPRPGCRTPRGPPRHTPNRPTTPHHAWPDRFGTARVGRPHHCPLPPRRRHYRLSDRRLRPWVHHRSRPKETSEDHRHTSQLGSRPPRRREGGWRHDAVAIADVPRRSAVPAAWTERSRSPERYGAATRPIPVDSLAVGSDAECCADLAHPRATQCSKALDEDADRDRLHGVEIDSAPATDRVIAGLENDLARQAPNRGRAWRHQRPAQPRDRGVAGEYDDWPSTDLGRFTPPQLASSRNVRHVVAAALRNESRSPHSSASSIGCSAYATAYASSISAARCRASSAVNASSISSASVAPARVRRTCASRSASTVVLIRVRAMP